MFIPYSIVEGFLENSELKVQIASDLGFTLLWTLYVVIGHGKYGQTLGKKAMKIKVLDISEEKLIGYKRAFLRELVAFLVSVSVSLYLMSQIWDLPAKEAEEYTNYYRISFYISVIWFLIEIVTTLTNKKYRAVHDYIAGSVVVRLDPKPVPAPE